MPDKKGGARNTISRETILRALKKANFNVTAAAVVLGKSRTWLKDKVNIRLTLTTQNQRVRWFLNWRFSG